MPASPQSDAVCARELTISNKRGLHARASARFVKCAEGFRAAVRVIREGQSVGGTSIMGLMMLTAGPGAKILVETSGPDAKAALDALTKLVDSKFGED